jgi:hypothetical protein
VTLRRPLRRSSHRARVAVLVLLGVVTGCAQSVEGVPAAESAPAAPSRAEELESYVVPSVPSGLPRLPDEKLSPPAGAKSLDDVASYAPDPSHERGVLEDYGYRFGWERVWGHARGPMTSVFVDQFETPEGASAYAEDLAANDADRFRGMLSLQPPELPEGCRMLTVAEPRAGTGLTGPTVFAWCGHGMYSVGVTSVASSVEAASAEVRAVLREQIDRLPTD